MQSVLKAILQEVLPNQPGEIQGKQKEMAGKQPGESQSINKEVFKEVLPNQPGENESI